MTCITLIVRRVTLEKPRVKCLAQGHNADRALSATANTSMWLSTELFSTKTYATITSWPNSAWDSTLSLKIICLNSSTHKTKMDPCVIDGNVSKIFHQLHKLFVCKTLQNQESAIKCHIKQKIMAFTQPRVPNLHDFLLQNIPSKKLFKSVF